MMISLSLIFLQLFTCFNSITIIQRIFWIYKDCFFFFFRFSFFLVENNFVNLPQTTTFINFINQNYINVHPYDFGALQNLVLFFWKCFCLLWRIWHTLLHLIAQFNAVKFAMLDPMILILSSQRVWLTFTWLNLATFSPTTVIPN